MRLGLVALGLLGLAGCSAKPKEARRRDGPMLSMTSLPAGGTAVHAAIPPGAAALALGGLAPEELPRLRESLGDSNDAAVRRAAPALFDLAGDPGAADEPLQRLLPDVPALTAAANVLGGPWSAPGLEVALGPACAAGATRCVPLFGGPSDDPLVRRARALAWSLSNAAILRIPAASRPAALRALRAAGTVALVFDAERGNLDPAQLDGLRSQAGRALAHLPPGAPQRAWLEGIAAAQAQWALPLPLGPDEVLVIPRLSALARLPRFEADLAAAGSFERVVRPGA